MPCLASFDQSSFNKEPEVNNPLRCQLTGTLICFNTEQELINHVKADHIQSIGLQISDSINSGEALSNPEGCLSRFSVLTYADIKKYQFKFIFSYPALISSSTIVYPNPSSSSRLIQEVFSKTAVDKLDLEFMKTDQCRSFQRGYFIIRHSKTSEDPTTDEIELFPLTSFLNIKKGCESNKQSTSIIYFAFSDPSGCQENPGWPLRNYIELINRQFKLVDINFVRIRVGSKSGNSQNRLQGSFVFNVQIRNDGQKCETTSKSSVPKVTGWEPDELGRTRLRSVDLSSLLNPEKLANDAVNLNLSLMKWRLMPSLDLERIASVRCLILGCGTLGCHIARGLVAWGVKKLTLIDNSRISYSNPVRQSLYNFEDCSSSGKGDFKAEVAARNLKKIHPTIEVESHVLSIPMPGHTVVPKDAPQVGEDVQKLDKLVEEHDTIFLLTDTRESRWLPTVIGVAKGKLVINAAIGFDTFLIQRHPVRGRGNNLEISAETTKREQATSIKGVLAKIPSHKLGCYFCNDIVAPGNSSWNRTLDQQCTVSRPGISMLVSSLVIELFASIWSNPIGPQIPAISQFPNNSSSITEQDYDSDLGIVPHSIRGDISRYHIYMPTSPSFNKCSGCSEQVILAYQNEGFDFLLRVFNDSSHLEEISGLKELHQFNFSDKDLELDSDDELCQEDE